MYRTQEQERWALCEVRLTMRTSWRITFTLEAVVTGPSGQEIIASRTFHRWMSYKALDQHPKMEGARASLAHELVAGGWEPLPSVMQPLPTALMRGVMLPRFRRRVA